MLLNLRPNNERRKEPRGEEPPASLLPDPVRCSVPGGSGASRTGTTNPPKRSAIYGVAPRGFPRARNVPPSFGQRGRLPPPPDRIDAPAAVAPEPTRRRIRVPPVQSRRGSDPRREDRLSRRHRRKRRTSARRTSDSPRRRNEGRSRGGKNTANVVLLGLRSAFCPRRVRRVRVRAQRPSGPPRARDDAPCVGDRGRDRLRNAPIPKRGTTAPPSTMPPSVGKACPAPCPKTDGTSTPADAG